MDVLPSVEMKIIRLFQPCTYFIQGYVLQYGRLVGTSATFFKKALFQCWGSFSASSINFVMLTTTISVPHNFTKIKWYVTIPLPSCKKRAVEVSWHQISQLERNARWTGCDRNRCLCLLYRARYGFALRFSAPKHWSQSTGGEENTECEILVWDLTTKNTTTFSFRSAY